MVTTDDERLAERLRLLRNLAFRDAPLPAPGAGFNFRMTGYQAAMGRVQLRGSSRIIEAKRRIARTYTTQLADVAGHQDPGRARMGSKRLLDVRDRGHPTTFPLTPRRAHAPGSPTAASIRGRSSAR